jgi:hypothetical protein
MTNVQAQEMVSSARYHIVRARQDRGEFAGEPVYQQAWQILFAAENLLSDPTNTHYAKVLEAARA